MVYGCSGCGAGGAELMRLSHNLSTWALPFAQGDMVSSLRREMVEELGPDHRVPGAASWKKRKEKKVWGKQR
jgi:hypothetical protein